MAGKPGTAWNPVFLHGDSGLGKTHLLHAVAAAILEKQGGGRVAIVSSERYTNDFVAALSKGVMEEFRRKYRECSALLVDDVQFLAGKDKTAEEFFHTFNELHDHHVQIVLSSDRSPKELKGLDDRLCSRFEWGMRVRIEPPEFETRAAILKKKAEVETIDLPDDVTDLLATHIRSNVRALEGAHDLVEVPDVVAGDQFTRTADQETEHAGGLRSEPDDSARLGQLACLEIEFERAEASPPGPDRHRQEL